MIFDKSNQYYKDKLKAMNVLRDLAFEVNRNSNEFIFKILGTKNTVEYWEYRLNIDKQQYGI